MSKDKAYRALVAHIQKTIQAAESYMGAVKTVEAIADAIRNEGDRSQAEGQHVRATIYEGIAEEINRLLSGAMTSNPR